MSTAGVISGTSVGPGWDAYVLNQHPNGYQHFNFTVTATDKYGYQGSRAYDHTMSAPTITLSPASSFPATISASGGTGSYIYSVSSGTLPPGWSLNGTTGAISGTAPSVGGTYNWTIEAVDSNGFAGYGNYTTTLPNTNRNNTPGGGKGSGGGGGTVTTGTTTAAGGTPATYTVSGGAAGAAGVQTVVTVPQPTGTSQTTSGVTAVSVTPVSTGVVTTQASNTNTACTTTSTTTSGTGSSIKVVSGSGTIGVGPGKNYIL